MRTVDVSDENNEPQDLFLAELGKLGGGATNKQLRAALGLDTDKKAYLDLRQVHIESGAVVLGKGQGGKVHLTEESAVEDGAPGSTSNSTKEHDLYEPIANMLPRVFEQVLGDDGVSVVETHSKSKRHGGGTWSHPDLTAWAVRKYEYLPTKLLDVVTFEVKREDSVDVTAVYESIAHRRASTHAYVVFPVAGNDGNGTSESVEDVVATAEEHGVGVLTFTDVTEPDSWNLLVRARRVEPDPWRLNEFVSHHLRGVSRELLRALK